MLVASVAYFQGERGRARLVGKVDAPRARGDNTVHSLIPLDGSNVHFCARSHVRTLHLYAFAALALGHGTPARAQGSPVTLFELSESPGVVERADRAYWEGDARESLRLLEGLLANTPDDADARWRAARASVALGIIANGEELENRWYRYAIAHADEALRLDSMNAEVVRWAVASKGQLALQTGPFETSRLAQEIWDMSHELLRRDPDDGFAHHALGTLHFEVMTLSRFERFLGRLFLGGDALSKASWDDAIYHHERAIAVEPSAIAFRVGFADTLTRRDRVHEAIEQLRRATSLPTAHPGDSDYRGQAERRLNELLAKGKSPEELRAYLNGRVAARPIWTGGPASSGACRKCWTCSPAATCSRRSSQPERPRSVIRT